MTYYHRIIYNINLSFLGDDASLGAPDEHG